MDPAGQNVPTDHESHPGLHALQWARVLSIIKQHGVTGMILVLLAWNLGFLDRAQSFGCGI